MWPSQKGHIFWMVLYAYTTIVRLRAGKKTVDFYVSVVREAGVEPARPKPLDPKSSASANSATLAD